MCPKHPYAHLTSLPTLFLWVLPDHCLWTPWFMHMYTWRMIFMHGICNFLCFTYENMGAEFSMWNTKSAFHFWKSSCIFLVMIHGLWDVTHLDVCAHFFLHEYGIVYISHRTIWAYIFLLEVWDFIYFPYENLH